MSMAPEVEAAIIGAAMSILAFVASLVVQGLVRRSQEARKTRIRYLYPLKLASDELFDRLGKLGKEIEDRKAAERGGEPGEPEEAGARFRRAKATCQTPDFYHRCNDDLCNPVGTLYATACYFASASTLREELPLVRLSKRKAVKLLQATEDVRFGLWGGCYGFWTEIQDSIGRLVMTDKGGVIPYASFCKALGSDPDSYNRLFDFYGGIDAKIVYELRWGYDALRDLRAVLEHILKIRSHQTPGGTWMPAMPAAPRSVRPPRRSRTAVDGWVERARAIQSWVKPMTPASPSMGVHPGA